MNENDSDKAIQLRNEYLDKLIEIAVPDLLLYEVSNALRYKKDFLTSEIKLIIESIFKSKISIVSPTLELIKNAIEFADYCDVSIYDSTFLSVANHLNYFLITADDRFYKKIILKNKNLKIKLLKNIIIN